MYVINRKGRDGRIFEGHWCAKSRSCSGGVTLDDAVVSNRAKHNHPVDMAEIKGHKIKSRLKTKIQETAQPLPALYSQEVYQVVRSIQPLLTIF